MYWFLTLACIVIGAFILHPIIGCIVLFGILATSEEY